MTSARRPPTTTTTVEPQPVAVTSDAPRVATLAELVASADVVVRGEVTATERGRLFGEPGAGAVESRLVTLRVDEVLAGEAPPEGPLVVEEEGWLEDGTPIVVDGAPPSTGGRRRHLVPRRGRHRRAPGVRRGERPGPLPRRRRRPGRCRRATTP